MNISEIDKDYIEKKMNQSEKSTRDVKSYSSFLLGWRAAIRFAKRVEDADGICLQCGKLLRIEKEKLDAGGNVFCHKCYEKLFGK